MARPPAKSRTTSSDGTTPTADFGQYHHEKELRKTLDRTLRSLEKAKASKEELVDAVFRAASDAIQALDIPPVPPPKKDTRKKDAEVALALMSDWQLSKVTQDYNSDICEQRVQRYAKKVINLANIQREDHPVNEVHVDFVGDEVEGELIFPGQSHLIDASLYEQVVVTGPRIAANLLRTLAANFQTVRVRHVDGNHGALGGRARRDYHPESNADSMMLEVTRKITADEPRIIWDSVKPRRERNWYDVDRIFDHGFLMFHGDQVKGGFAGFPWYGFAKKLQGWSMTIPEPFKYALGGHFHTPVRFYQNGLTYWGNGSTESSNTYALEQLAAAGEPCQWLLFVHPDGVSAEYLVRLA